MSLQQAPAALPEGQADAREQGGEGASNDSNKRQEEQPQQQQQQQPAPAPLLAAIDAGPPAPGAAARRPRVLLGASGSVAAIKLGQLAALLLEFAEVRVVATRSARYFFQDPDLPPACRPALGEPAAEQAAAPTGWGCWCWGSVPGCWELVCMLVWWVGWHPATASGPTRAYTRTSHGAALLILNSLAPSAICCARSFASYAPNSCGPSFDFCAPSASCGAPSSNPCAASPPSWQATTMSGGSGGRWATPWSTLSCGAGQMRWSSRRCRPTPWPSWQGGSATTCSHVWSAPGTSGGLRGRAGQCGREAVVALVGAAEAGVAALREARLT